jgi:hypothetical protein
MDLLSRRLSQPLQSFTIHIPQHDVITVTPTSKHRPAALTLETIHAAGAVEATSAYGSYTGEL